MTSWSASRFPTVGVFDDIAEGEDELRVAFLLENLTNPPSQARLAALPAGELAAGPSGSIVMAAFLHASDEGGRFNDGELGAWFASGDLPTAFAETAHHHERRLRASAAGFPARIQMRQLSARTKAKLLDLRGARESRPELYDLDDYSAAQAFARERRWPYADPSEDGLVFQSVRHLGGINICLFRPKAIALPVAQGDHYEYVWNGSGALSIVKLTLVRR
ncbi:RES family NAD+ phosphorylase [Phenylobacterium koreense]|uniref:RES domain-containing protein n=1 Tax=Phenylobacterium koreense TaxID=266125 RepID=A0ABV2ELV9_9CAUL